MTSRLPSPFMSRTSPALPQSGSARPSELSFQTPLQLPTKARTPSSAAATETRSGQPSLLKSPSATSSAPMVGSPDEALRQLPLPSPRYTNTPLQWSATATSMKPSLFTSMNAMPPPQYGSRGSPFDASCQAMCPSVTKIHGPSANREIAP